jgi:hypothetical protein
MLIRILLMLYKASAEPMPAVSDMKFLSLEVLEGRPLLCIARNGMADYVT